MAARQRGGTVRGQSEEQRAAEADAQNGRRRHAPAAIDSLRVRYHRSSASFLALSTMSRSRASALEVALAMIFFASALAAR